MCRSNRLLPDSALSVFTFTMYLVAANYYAIVILGLVMSANVLRGGTNAEGANVALTVLLSCAGAWHVMIEVLHLFIPMAILQLRVQVLMNAAKMLNESLDPIFARFGYVPAIPKAEEAKREEAADVKIATVV